jgi:hypothetical protein
MLQDITLYEPYDLLCCDAMWFVLEEHNASNFRIEARNWQKHAASSGVGLLLGSLFSPEDGGIVLL